MDLYGAEMKPKLKLSIEQAYSEALAELHCPVYQMTLKTNGGDIVDYHSNGERTVIGISKNDKLVMYDIKDEFRDTRSMCKVTTKEFV